jgi:hypothetical protein
MAKISKIFHADHGISPEVLGEMLDVLSPAEGFFLRTGTLPDHAPDVQNALYGPAAGDPAIDEAQVVYRQRTPDRPMSRMVELPTRPTRLVTIIGINGGDEGYTLFTAYGGPAAEREVGDKSLVTDAQKATAAAFWSQHALAAL